MLPPPPAVDPWLLDLVVVRDGSHSSGERRALSRAVEAGLLLRLREGVYVERAAFEALTPEGQHLVRMRALAAVSSAPVVFSHWSAALVHGLPVMRARLDRVHVTAEADGLRRRAGVTQHFFSLGPPEVVAVRGLGVTSLGRAVVDVAGAGPIEEGVMAVDAALRAGWARDSLSRAAELAGDRRAGRRIADVIAFGHPGAESAGESRFRVSAYRLGVEVPELQHRIALADGRDAFLDAYFPLARVGAEFDGDAKYLDPEMAPLGARRAVIAEKRREDEVRSHLRGLARFGWQQACSPVRLREVLARAGVVSRVPRTPFDDWCAAAALAVPRSPARRTFSG